MVSKKQIILIAVLVIIIGLIVALGMYKRQDKAKQADQGTKTTDFSNVKADQYVLNGKVVAINSQNITLEVPQTRTNAAGVAESTMIQKIIVLDKFINFEKISTGKSSPATVQDIKIGQNLVVYTWINPFQHDTIQVSRINIQ